MDLAKKEVDELANCPSFIQVDIEQEDTNHQIQDEVKVNNIHGVSVGFANGMKKLNPFARVSSGAMKTANGEDPEVEDGGLMSKNPLLFTEISQRSGKVYTAVSDKLSEAATKQPGKNINETDLMSGGINIKKTMANGLMDFAFLTANANQLHHAIKSANKSSDRDVCIALISISIALQILAGVLLIVASYIQSRPDDANINFAEAQVMEASKQLERSRWLTFIDHLTIAIVFIIAVFNIFISALALEEPS